MKKTRKSLNCLIKICVKIQLLSTALLWFSNSLKPFFIYLFFFSCPSLLCFSADLTLILFCFFIAPEFPLDFFFFFPSSIFLRYDHNESIRLDKFSVGLLIVIQIYHAPIYYHLFFLFPMSINKITIIIIYLVFII